MALSERSVRRRNLAASGVSMTKGSMEELGSLLMGPGGEPRNFVLSGQGTPQDRYMPLVAYLSRVMGCWPLVVLHARDTMLEELVASVWHALGDAVPLWGANQANPTFEPLFGMGDMQVVGVVRTLAERLGYVATPRLERVVRAHLEILRHLGVPTSLSGLHYLCSFHDMGELHGNVLQLPCGQDQAIRIWSDMGADVDDGQFDLFRSVIENLAHEATRSGWDAGAGVATYNAHEAIRQGATLCLSIDNERTSLMLAYLAEELRGAPSPYVLLLDGISIADEAFSDLLLTPSSNMRFGVLSTNVVDLMAGDVERFNRLAERVSTMVLLKHNTNTAATALAEVMGRYDAVRVSESAGTSRGFFKVLPQDRRRDQSVTTENRYRVMPEEILALGPGSAIVFDTTTDQVMFHN